MSRRPKRRPGETRRLVGRLRSRGLSYSQIAARLNISKGSIAYHCRANGIPVDERCARRYDWSEIRTAYESGLSARVCAQRFGISRSSWADAVRRGDISPRDRKTPIEQLLQPDAPASIRRHLKDRLFEAGLKERRCEGCGIQSWNGAPLALQVHHINGNGRDNRLENLQLLCPNCHSQTETFAGRNRGRKLRGAITNRKEESG